MKDVLLYVHIAAGGLSLCTGTLIAVLRKGNQVHRNAGRGYCLCMALTCLSGALLSLYIESPFLLAIAAFSASLTWNGWRWRPSGNQVWESRIGLVLGMVTALLLIWQTVQGIWFSGIFALICLIQLMPEIKYHKRPIAFEQRNILHIQGIGGSLISAWTAFIVVNYTWNHAWIAWLTPTLIGSLLISYAIRKRKLNRIAA